LFAAIIVFTSLALAGCGDSGHGGHASSGHGSSHGSDSGHGSDASHDSHGAESSHGESSHGGHGADAHGGDSHGGHGATAEAPASHGPTDEELETGIAFIARPRQLVEVDLGEVYVTLQGPDETTYLFESQLFGLVDEGHLAEFDHALANRREAMREALRSTIAKSDTKDLFDPKLAGVKITLAAVARKTLGSPHLYDILFSNLSIKQD
jgi:hypothetical protein